MAIKKASNASKIAQKKTAKKTVANVAMIEAAKTLEKHGKKIPVAKKVRASAAMKVSDVSPELDEPLSRVEKYMAGRSKGTIESAKSLITKVAKKYDVASIDENLAKKAVDECGLLPRSKANLRWSMKIAIAAAQ